VLVVREITMFLALCSAFCSPGVPVIGVTGIACLAAPEQSLEFVRHGSRSFDEQVMSPMTLLPAG
jgi:hypothetical protein